MAIRFWEMYEETKEQFKLRIVAGKNGMDTVVSWVHMLEDETIVSRFSGEELAITTGMKAGQPDWLLHLVQGMEKKECAGIIVNTGMYLKEIPKEVTAWCEEHQFPLLIMPWEISITRLIQDFCMRIINQGQYEVQIGDAFREAMKGKANREDYERVLGQIYDIDGTFQAFCLYLKRTLEDELNVTHAILKMENMFGLWKGSKKINISYGLVRMDDFMVLVLNNMQDQYFLELPDMISQCFAYFDSQNRFCMGIGPKVKNIVNLSISFKRARTAMKMALGTGQKSIEFDKMGFYKLLFSIEDTEILTGYADQILGPLEEYDDIHNSEYVATLRSYIENDRSLIGVADATYTHRNTVNYRIQNIKRLLGCELKTTEDLFPYQVAFYIRDMANKKK